MTEYLSLPLPALWAALAGSVLPVLLAVVNRRTWSSGIKQGVMLAGVLIATAGTMFVTGVLVPTEQTWEAWASTLIVLYLTTTATYRASWKPSGVTDRIEDATSPAPRRAQEG